MKEYITLVFSYENEQEFEEARSLAMNDKCAGWSMDHENHRVFLMHEAWERGLHDLVGEIFSLENCAKYNDLDELIKSKSNTQEER